MVVVALANGAVAFAYTGNSLECFFAGVWAIVPFLVFDWWATPESETLIEQVAVFVSTIIVTSFGTWLFVSRVWNGLETIPETLLFPAVAPMLLFAVMLVLMVLTTIVGAVADRASNRTDNVHTDT